MARLERIGAVWPGRARHGMAGRDSNKGEEYGK
jgi:hypothetical protein